MASSFTIGAGGANPPTGSETGRHIQQLVGNGVTIDFDDFPMVELRTIDSAGNIGTQDSGAADTLPMTHSGTSDANGWDATFTDSSGNTGHVAGIDVVNNTDREYFEFTGSAEVGADVEATESLHSLALRFKLSTLGSTYKLYTPYYGGALIDDPQSGDLIWDRILKGSTGSSAVGTDIYPIHMEPGRDDIAGSPNQTPRHPDTSGAGVPNMAQIASFTARVPFFYLWDSSNDEGLMVFVKDPTFRYKWISIFRDGGRLVFELTWFPNDQRFGVNGSSDETWDQEKLILCPFKGNLFEAAAQFRAWAEEDGETHYTYRSNQPVANEEPMLSHVEAAIFAVPQDATKDVTRIAEVMARWKTRFPGVSTLVSLWNCTTLRWPEVEAVDDLVAGAEKIRGLGFPTGLYLHPTVIDTTSPGLAGWVAAACQKSNGDPQTFTIGSTGDKYFLRPHETAAAQAYLTAMRDAVYALGTFDAFYLDAVSRAVAQPHYNTSDPTNERGAGADTYPSAFESYWAQIRTTFRGKSLFSEIPPSFGGENFDGAIDYSPGWNALDRTFEQNILQLLGAVSDGDALDRVTTFVDLSPYIRAGGLHRYSWQAAPLTKVPNVNDPSTYPPRTLELILFAYSSDWHDGYSWTLQWNYRQSAGSADYELLPDPQGDDFDAYFQWYVDYLYRFAQRTFWVDTPLQRRFERWPKLPPVAASHELDLVDNGLDFVVGVSGPIKYVRPGDSLQKHHVSVLQDETTGERLVKVSNWSEDDVSFSLVLDKTKHLSTLEQFDLWEVTSQGRSRIGTFTNESDLTMTVSIPAHDGRLYLLSPPSGNLVVTSIQSNVKKKFSRGKAVQGNVLELKRMQRG